MSQLLNPIHNINPNHILIFDENPRKLRILSIATRKLDNEMIMFGLNALSCLSPYYNMTTSSVRIYLKKDNITYEQMETNLNLSFTPDELFSTYEIMTLQENVRCDHYYTIHFPRLFIEINNTQFILKALFSYIYDLDNKKMVCEFISMDQTDILSLVSVQKAPFHDLEWACRYNFNYNWSNIVIPAIPLGPVGVIYNFKMQIVIRGVAFKDFFKSNNTIL